VLEKRVPVPYVPNFKNKLDVSNFEDEFTNEPIQLSPIQGTLDAFEQELFRGFTYVNDNLPTIEESDDTSVNEI